MPGHMSSPGFMSKHSFLGDFPLGSYLRRSLATVVYVGSECNVNGGHPWNGVHIKQRYPCLALALKRLNPTLRRCEGN